MSISNPIPPRRIGFSLNTEGDPMMKLHFHNTVAAYAAAAVAPPRVAEAATTKINEHAHLPTLEVALLGYPSQTFGRWLSEGLGCSDAVIAHASPLMDRTIAQSVARHHPLTGISGGTSHTGEPVASTGKAAIAPLSYRA